MVIKLRFIAKVTNMGERTMVLIPKELDKDSRRLRGKFARIAIDEIPIEEEKR